MRQTIIMSYNYFKSAEHTKIVNKQNECKVSEFKYNMFKHVIQYSR